MSEAPRFRQRPAFGLGWFALLELATACSCEVTVSARGHGGDAAADAEGAGGVPGAGGGAAAGGRLLPGASGGSPGTGGAPLARDAGVEGGDAAVDSGDSAAPDLPDAGPVDAAGDAVATADAGQGGDAAAAVDAAGDAVAPDGGAPLPSCLPPGRAIRGSSDGGRPGGDGGLACGRATLPGEDDHSGTWLVLTPGGHRAETDADGAFCFPGVPPGTYEMNLENGAFAGNVPQVAISPSGLDVPTALGPVPLPELVLARGRVLASACSFGFGGSRAVHVAPDASKLLASCSVTGLPKSLVPRPLVSTTRPALELVSIADGTRTRLATGEDPAGVFPYSLLTDWWRNRVIHADSDHAGILDFSGTSGSILAAPRPPELAAGAALALSQDGAFLVRFGDPLLAFPLGGGPAITLEVGASQVRFATGGMELLYLVGATGELVRQDVDGTDRTVLVTVPALPGRTALRLSGDGARVAYALGASASTCSLVTTERGAVPVSLGACDEAPLFTGDNAHVVWADEPEADGKVTTLLVAESANPLASALVTAAPGESLDLVGTVGTGHVLFTRTLPSGSASLELIPLRSGPAVVLDADVDVNAIQYRVSPDQRQILLMPSPNELVSHDLGSGQFRTLSRQATADTLSVWPWSPRGTYIVFRECSLPGCAGPGDAPTTVLARADDSAPARRYPAIPARPPVMDFSADESKILIQDAGRLFWVDVPTGIATEVARFANQSGPALWLDSNRFLFTDVAGLPGIYLSSACSP